MKNYNYWGSHTSYTHACKTRNKLGFTACNASKKFYRLKILQRQITEKFKKNYPLCMADGGQPRWYLLHTMLNYVQNCGIYPISFLSIYLRSIFKKIPSNCPQNNIFTKFTESKVQLWCIINVKSNHHLKVDIHKSTHNPAVILYPHVYKKVK